MTIEEAVRIEGGQVLATLIRFTGDIDLAEDAWQDASLEAVERWGREGIPDNPGAWLTTVARNKAVDRIRREARRREKETEAISLHQLGSGPQDMLSLIFMCAHPALSVEAQVGLTLRLVAGLTVAQVADLFLEPEATVAQRISRAKRKISLAHIPYRVPPDYELPDRLTAVLAVLYLIFTAGHHPSEGDLDSQAQLAKEAIRLGRSLLSLMPDEPEVGGLLALMVATEARRSARIDGEGNQVLLADQDRTRWNREAIAEASSIIERALRRRRPGPYQIQGAIACLHGQAESDAATDWKQISDLYRMLEKYNDGPVIRANRAVAEAKVFGPEAGLLLLDSIDGLDGWHFFWAARAELLREAGRLGEAQAALGRALALDMNDSDRSLLLRRWEQSLP